MDAQFYSFSFACMMGAYDGVYKDIFHVTYLLIDLETEENQ